jgi:hydrogenase nickel incorporation protein HypA/HybF
VHEFSVTSQIVENILKEAEKHEAKKIVQVNLTIGKLTFLGIEQVRFAYKLLVKDTIAEKSRLVIKEKHGIVKCSKCGYEGDFKYEDNPMYHIPTPSLKCPKCENTVNIIGGKECTIESIKLVTDKDEDENK